MNNTIIVDKRGDLILVVGADCSEKRRDFLECDEKMAEVPVRFLVDSSRLRRRPGLFRDLLAGPWLADGVERLSLNPVGSRSDGDVDRVLELREEHPRIVGMFMMLLHGLYHQAFGVAQGVEWEREDLLDGLGFTSLIFPLEWLHEVTAFSRRFDLAEVLAPWAEQWLSTVRDDDDVRNQAYRMSICYELGDEGLFSSSLRIFLHGAVNKGHGRMLVAPKQRAGHLIRQGRIWNNVENLDTFINCKSSSSNS
jgi:hypothetical protein